MNEKNIGVKYEGLQEMYLNYTFMHLKLKKKDSLSTLIKSEKIKKLKS